LSDDFVEIRAALDRGNSFWTPEPGDELVGAVVAVDRRTGQFGDYLVVTIDNGDEEVGVPATGSVLSRHLERVKVGDKVGIRFLGEGMSKSGRRYKNYTVRIKKAREPEPTLEDFV
jgi:hypothetical protein